MSTFCTITTMKIGGGLMGLGGLVAQALIVTGGTKASFFNVLSTFCNVLFNSKGFIRYRLARELMVESVFASAATLHTHCQHSKHSPVWSKHRPVC